jgi:Na+-driven multidrug efflux pump
MSGVIYGVVYLMMNRVAGAIGPAAQGGLGTGLRGIEWVAFAIGEGFLIACLAWVGQHLGAGRVDRLVRGLWAMILAGGIVVQLISLPFWWMPDALASAIAADVETASMAAIYLRIMAWGMWAVAVDLAIHGALTGAGLTHVSMAIGLVGNLARVPLAAIAVFGAAWAEAVVWILTGVGTAPVVVGGFAGVAWAICLSAIGKAVVYVTALARVDWNYRVGIEREIEALH